MRSNPDLKKLLKWLQAEITPTATGDSGPLFRAAAYLLDGTYLPCVSFRSPQRIIDLAIDRFEQTRNDASLDGLNDYRAIVKTYVATGSRVSCWDIAAIERSRFALPAALRDQIYTAGETSMSSITFVGRMQDGTEYAFASTFEIEFFEMPIGYSADQLIDVLPHRQIDGHRYSALPFFECFVDGL